MDCLLFDCDGTLVDSERLGNVGLVVLFRELGVELDADELVARFRGWRLIKILEEIGREEGVAIPSDFLPKYRQAVLESFEQNLRPIEGVHSALDRLPHPKAVVSSGPLPKIVQALRCCDLSHYFGENLISAYEVGIWKPDPGLYLHAARHMSVPASRCGVVEDSLLGVEAAVGAEMQCFYFNPGEEACQLPGVMSFRRMVDLPQLVATHSD
ncbi:MAG: haloacid dehalogenase [bacterium TMED88]|nr:haloacid dehalogenase [Deltaproteobacteria bacterium]OUV28378.1 MAG: haloacid dehalogenase [bacterium TMED88]